jgi:uncharacterized repeat protein (TIGR01451 family)
MISAASSAVLHAAAGGGSGADVQLSGSSNTSSPDAGGVIAYTFQMRNSGPDSATAVTLTDALPAGTTFGSALVVAFDSVGGPVGCTQSNGTVSCGVGSMARGGSATVVVTLIAPTAQGPFANLATASASSADPNPGNNSATVNAQVKNNAAAGACPLPPGQTTIQGRVMVVGSVAGPNGPMPQNFEFVTDAGQLYWVQTNYYDAAAGPLTSVINLDCKTSPVQFITAGGALTVTGTVGAGRVNSMQTFNASVAQVPTHKDKA